MHEDRTPDVGSAGYYRGEPSDSRRLRSVAGGTRPDDHAGRDIALMALAVGAGALWIWSRAPGSRKTKRRPDMPALAAGRGLHVERTVTVRRSADEVYQAWRDLERLPRLLPESLVSVTPSGPRRSDWVVRGPGGVRLSWQAELMADEEDRLLAWRSVPGSNVDIAGSVRFTSAPKHRGTEVKVILTYSPPGGKLGAAAATLFGRNGDRLVREALRRFKQLMEAGEIAVGSPWRASESRAAAAPIRRTA